MAIPRKRPNSGFQQASNNFWDGWLKNPKPAMIRCNDGFQPVSFCIEALDENGDETQNGAERTGSQRRIKLHRNNQRKGFSPKFCVMLP